MKMQMYVQLKEKEEQQEQEHLIKQEERLMSADIEWCQRPKRAFRAFS